MQTTLVSRLDSFGAGAVLLLSFAGLLGIAESMAVVPGGGSDVVRVTLKTGQMRDFPPAVDSDEARGEALVSAVDWANDFARKAAEDGCVYRSALLRHSDGNFYGTATVGGRNDRAGVLFQLGTGGKYRVIHHFAAASGTNPRAAPVEGPDGALYGTAEGGGREGYGVIFRATTGGSYSVLHHFDRQNGAYPMAPLCRASDQSFYGTTFQGGSHGLGVIFQLTWSGDFRVMHSFSGAEGSQPTSGLVEAAGSLYGVTSRGGGPTGWGTVFNLGFDGGFTLLHTFRGQDGANPFGSLCLAPDGWLYGATFSGGAKFVYTTGLNRGEGTVFKISRAGEFMSVHSFDPHSGGGQHPVAGLVAASDGLLYGTTREGGKLNRGAVYCLGTNGRVQIVKSLRGSDGYLPSASLIEGKDGYLYGTSQLGGRNDAGAVFRLKKDGSRHAVLRSAPMPTAGAQIRIGRGTYDVPSIIYLRGADMQLTGAGMEQTTLRRSAGQNRDESLIRGVYYSGLAGGRWSVSDLTVDSNLQGQSAPVNAGCVGLLGSGNSITRVRAINWGSRIRGSECFPLSIGTSGGGDLNDTFILGEGHGNVISYCVVDTPAPVVHLDGVTAIGINGGNLPNYSLPGNGWDFRPLIHHCVVRGSNDPAVSPVYFHGYSISMTQGGVVRNNLAEDLLVDSGGYCGFYHDTGSIYDALIQANRFIRCTRGVVFYLQTTTAVFQRGITIFNNEIECPPDSAENFGISFLAGNLNEIDGVNILRNQIRSRTGIRLDGALPIRGIRISGNKIDSTVPWSLTNVPVPVIVNNRNRAGGLLPER